MADDVLGLEHIGVEQRELSDAGHGELQRNLSAARAASGNQRSRVGERANVKKRRYAGKKLIIIHRLILPASATARRYARLRNFGAIVERVSKWRALCACRDS